jgi:hypothetical protein
MASDRRLEAQIDLIIEGLPDAAAFPPDWREQGRVDYLYREGSILVRDRNLESVRAELLNILRSWPRSGDERADETATGQVEQVEQARPPVTRVLPVIDGVARLEYRTRDRRTDLPTVPEVLDRIDATLGHYRATPDTILNLCGQGHACPADEPGEVPPSVAGPFPAPAEGIRCTGENVLVSIVDTGFLPGADTAHSWLAGVEGDPEQPFDPTPAGPVIRKYAGHGTFVAGCVRCTAPKAAVYVEGASVTAGSDYESNLAPQLGEALEKSPDVVLFTYAGPTRLDQPLPAFDALYESRLRAFKGVAVLAPAGNEGNRDVMWPAAYPWAISVGALSANWRSRAYFSNFGGWVDVYAPGEDLINAFATGRYVCDEAPNTGVERNFAGLAKWSGTSFSTPLVAGLIAARMSVTGENGQQAAASLLEFARSQAIPGVGAVLFPGQACCEVSDRSGFPPQHCDDRRPGGRRI